MLDQYVPPPKLRVALKAFGAHRKIRLLDIGCGNHSPTITKIHLPLCEYHGVDIADYNIDARDKQLMDRFTLVNVDGTGYDALPVDYFDYIVLNHVIEHMDKFEPVLAALCRCLQPGGRIYIAFPSEKSLGLPSAQGTLQFCDDATHVYLPSVREVANVLIRHGVRVEYGGRSRDWIRAAIGVPLLLVQWARRCLGRPMHARGLWFLLGFEAVVVGVKRSSRPEDRS